MKQPSPLFLVLSLWAVTLPGCDEPRSTPVSDWDGVLWDSAGIKIVENFGTPLWREGESWEFTEVLRIGVAEGSEEYTFGLITGLAVLSDRRVVVADAMGHHVKYFSPEGIHERTVGTYGRGPGDFGSRKLGLFQGPGDTLVVLDQQNLRGHTLAPNGTWLGSFSASPRDGYWRALLFWNDDPQTGHIVSRYRAEQWEDPETVLHHDVHGAVLDTVVRVPPARSFAAGNSDLEVFYDGLPVSQLCFGVLVTGNTDQYRLLWYELDGTLSRIVSLAREPLEMTDEDISVFMQGYEVRWQEDGYSPQGVGREK